VLAPPTPKPATDGAADQAGPSSIFGGGKPRDEKVHTETVKAPTPGGKGKKVHEKPGAAPAPVDVEDGAAAGADKPKPERPKKEKAPMIRKDVRGNGNDKKKQKEKEKVSRIQTKLLTPLSIYIYIDTLTYTQCGG
jgi:hypothetical protein